VTPSCLALSSSAADINDFDDAQMMVTSDRTGTQSGEEERFATPAVIHAGRKERRRIARGGGGGSRVMTEPPLIRGSSS